MHDTADMESIVSRVRAKLQDKNLPEDLGASSWNDIGWAFPRTQWSTGFAAVEFAGIARCLGVDVHYAHASQAGNFGKSLATQVSKVFARVASSEKNSATY